MYRYTGPAARLMRRTECRRRALAQRLVGRFSPYVDIFDALLKRRTVHTSRHAVGGTSSSKSTSGHADVDVRLFGELVLAGRRDERVQLADLVLGQLADGPLPLVAELDRPDRGPDEPRHG